MKLVCQLCLYAMIKKYISHSELWLKKKKENHCFGGLCHPFFMVTERAALSVHERQLTYKQMERKKAEDGVFKQARK